VLSSELFNLYLEEALCSNPILRGKYLHGSIKAYAEDLVCSFDSREDGERVFAAFEALHDTWSLQINKEKSTALSDLPLKTIAGIKVADRPKYLGMPVCLDNME